MEDKDNQSNLQKPGSNPPDNYNNLNNTQTTNTGFQQPTVVSPQNMQQNQQAPNSNQNTITNLGATSINAHQNESHNFQTNATAGNDSATKSLGNTTKKSKILIPIILVVMLVIGGAAAAYNTLVLNSPSGIWSRALSNTYKGIGNLVDSLKEEQQPGGSIEGSYKVSSPTVIDGNVSGRWYESKATINADVGFAGLRPKIELRSIPLEDTSTPDLYIKLDDVAGFGGLLGAFNPQFADIVDEVDGSWYTIDHTLIEQALLSSADSNTPDLEFTPEEIDEIGDKIAAVLGDRLFTDDESKAVVIVEEPIGEEDFEGDKTYKYNVRVQKQQTIDFVNELVQAIKGTKLEELLLLGTDDKSLEGVLDLEDFIKSIEEQDFSSATAEAWVDLDTYLIRNIRIYPERNSSGNGNGYVDLGLDYENGEELPFVLKVVFEGEQEKANTEFRATYNRETKSVNLGFDIDVSAQNGENIVAEGNLSVTPNNDDFELSAPEDPKNIYELLGLIYSSSFTQPSDDFIDFDEFDSLPGGTLGATDELNFPPLFEQLLEL